ncbi:entry exclusion protein, partial [Salmonella enterica subsp. enterica serovar 4,[5],12:i:-]
MKNLAQIVLVTVVQFIACYLAEWESLKQGLS